MLRGAADDERRSALVARRRGDRRRWRARSVRRRGRGSCSAPWLGRGLGVMLVHGGCSAGLAPLQHVHRPRHRLRARAERARGALRRPPRRVVHASSSRSPDASDPALRRAPAGAWSTVPPRRCRRAADAAARRRAATSSTATSSRRSTLAEAKGYSDDLAAAVGQPRRRRARVRDRRRRDPARPRPDLRTRTC